MSQRTKANRWPWLESTCQNSTELNKTCQQEKCQQNLRVFTTWFDPLPSRVFYLKSWDRKAPIQGTQMALSNPVLVLYSIHLKILTDRCQLAQPLYCSVLFILPCRRRNPETFSKKTITDQVRLCNWSDRTRGMVFNYQRGD